MTKKTKGQILLTLTAFLTAGSVTALAWKAVTVQGNNAPIQNTGTETLLCSEPNGDLANTESS